MHISLQGPKYKHSSVKHLSLSIPAHFLLMGVTWRITHSALLTSLQFPSSSQSRSLTTYHTMPRQSSSRKDFQGCTKDRHLRISGLVVAAAAKASATSGQLSAFSQHTNNGLPRLAPRQLPDMLSSPHVAVPLKNFSSTHGHPLRTLADLSPGVRELDDPHSSCWRP